MMHGPINIRNIKFSKAHVRVYFSKNDAKALKPKSLNVPYTCLRLAEEHNNITAIVFLPSSVFSILVLWLKCLSPVLKQDKKCTVPLAHTS